MIIKQGTLPVSWMDRRFKYAVSANGFVMEDF